MVGKIVKGVIEVVSEISVGLKDACLGIFSGSGMLIDNLNIRMMGSYKDIEKLKERQNK